MKEQGSIWKSPLRAERIMACLMVTSEIVRWDKWAGSTLWEATQFSSLLLTCLSGNLIITARERFLLDYAAFQAHLRISKRHVCLDSLSASLHINESEAIRCFHNRPHAPSF